MIKSITTLGLGLFMLIVFLCVYNAMTHEQIWKSTLGIFTKNPVKESGRITNEKVPFKKIKEEDMYAWDAAHYKNVRDNLYKQDNDNWAYAFFPLFPWVWRLSGLSAIGISILNYLLFALALFIIMKTVMIPKNWEEDTLLYILALILPTTVVYQLPYTESFFIFTYSIAIIGIFKKEYWLYFVGMFLFSMVRPIITVILISFLCLDVYYFLLGRKLKTTVFDFFLKILPILLGTLIAILYQYSFSGDFFLMFKVEKEWGVFFRMPGQITDWSHEGYGMSIFAIFFVTLSSAGYLIYKFFKPKRTRNTLSFPFISEDKGWLRQYFFDLSIIYFLGMFLVVLLFRGGSLNGLQRYTLATPFFYFFLFELINRIRSGTDKKKLIAIFLVTLFLSFLFISVGPYGRHWNYRDGGYILWVLSGFFILYLHRLPQKAKYYLGFVLILLLVLWKAYLLNIFISNGYIYT